MGRVSRTVRRLARGMNQGRYERVMRTLGVRPSDRILELGCGRGDRSVAARNPVNEIVGIDRLPKRRVVLDQPNFRYVRGDAADLSAFPDDAFDVAVSFGMLEHVQPPDRLQAAIREAQRVARRYCFVVPHRYAFLEPHFLLPLFPLWPDRLKSALIRRFPLGSQPRNEAGEWQRIHWLRRREWRALFADPTLRIENHWYGPILLDYLIFGGELPGEAAGAVDGAAAIEPTEPLAPVESLAPVEAGERAAQPGRSSRSTE